TRYESPPSGPRSNSRHTTRTADEENRIRSEPVRARPLREAKVRVPARYEAPVYCRASNRLAGARWLSPITQRQGAPCQSISAAGGWKRFGEYPLAANAAPEAATARY